MREQDATRPSGAQITTSTDSQGTEMNHMQYLPVTAFLLLPAASLLVLGMGLGIAFTVAATRRK